MGSSGPKTPQPAELYEEDEQGQQVSGSRRTASTKKKKEEKERRRPKLSQHASDKKQPKSDPGLEAGGYDPAVMMTGARHDEDLGPREVKVERRRSSAGTSSKSKKYDSKVRPKTKTVRSDESTYYGVPAPRAIPPAPMAQPIPHRPQPTIITGHPYSVRPQSYHAPYSGGGYNAPPISNPSFWQNQAYYLPPQAQPPPQFAPAAPSPQDYLPAPSSGSSRSLRKRFGGPERTGSGFGFRDPVIQQRRRDDYEDGGYASAMEGASPRASIRTPSTRQTIRPRPKTDAEMMPPPPPPSGRRGILRSSSHYRGEEMTTLPAPEYRGRERDGRVYLEREERPRRRSSAHRSSRIYDVAEPPIETANHGRRRQSYHGQTASIDSMGSSGSASRPPWEHKAAQAVSYQDGVSGSANPLDAFLRQGGRQGGSSRSTKSSGSRDESDYRKSATTRTTRSVSSPEDENVTIKVTGGGARVTVGGAQIDCGTGGEIEITKQKSLRGLDSVRGGSEWSNSEYGDPHRQPTDDRWSRIDKPASQSRRRSVSYARQAGGFF